MSIAGNKLHTSGTEALNREKFYSSMCDKRTFSSLIALLKLNLKPLCACVMGDMGERQHNWSASKPDLGLCLSFLNILAVGN